MTISKDEVICGFERLEVFVWLEESAGGKSNSNSDEQSQTSRCYFYHRRRVWKLDETRDCRTRRHGRRLILRDPPIPHLLVLMYLDHVA